MKILALAALVFLVTFFFALQLAKIFFRNVCDDEVEATLTNIVNEPEDHYR